MCEQNTGHCYAQRCGSSERCHPAINPIRPGCRRFVQFIVARATFLRAADFSGKAIMMSKGSKKLEEGIRENLEMFDEFWNISE